MKKIALRSKGQAAMEFLMTYGWAILVVLIVIGVLAYFGVLKPGGLLPEKCTFPVSISCLDAGVTDSYFVLSLQNGAGKEIRIRGMTATGDALGEGNLCTTKVGGGAPLATDDCPTSTGAGVNGCVDGFTFRNGESKLITLAEGTCAYVDNGRDINRYNVTLFYSWADNVGLVHIMDGEVLTRKP